MTLTEILASCYRRTSQPPVPPSPVIARFIDFVNETEEQLLSFSGLADVTSGSIALASVADQPVYALPAAVDRVVAVRDPDNQWRLRYLSPDQYRVLAADPEAVSGTPTHYSPLGFRSVALDPSAAAELFLISTSSSDTQKAFYEVVTSEGQHVAGEVTLNGQTGVSLSASLTTIVEAVDLYLQSGAVGTVTLRQASGVGTVLSTIYPATERSRYQRVALFPTPADVASYTLDYERARRALINGNDESVLPRLFHRLLGIGARMKEYETTGDTRRYVLAERQFEEGRKQLIGFLGTSPDEVIVPGGQRVRPPSVLGPWTDSPPYRSR